MLRNPARTQSPETLAASIDESNRIIITTKINDKTFNIDLDTSTDK